MLRVRDIQTDKEYFSLNEVADLRLIGWRDIATVRKYVKTYKDVFNPKERGVGKAHRFVIAREDIDRFNQLFREGKLKGVRNLWEGEQRVQEKFVSLVYMPTLKRSAKALLAELLKAKYRVDLYQVETRREFSSFISGMEETHRALIFMLDTDERVVLFPSGETVSSTQIRQASSYKGVRGKAVIMYTKEELPRFEKAFREKGGVSFYREVRIAPGNAGTKSIFEVLKSITTTRRNASKLSNVIRRPSGLKRAK